MPVDVHRDLDRRVPALLLDLLRVRPCRDADGHIAVAEVVPVQVRAPSPGPVLLPASKDRAWCRAYRAGFDEIGLRECAPASTETGLRSPRSVGAAFDWVAPNPVIGDASASYCVQPPGARDTLQLVLAPILELDTRPNYEWRDGARYEDLARTGCCRHSGADVDREPGYVLAA